MPKRAALIVSGLLALLALGLFFLYRNGSSKRSTAGATTSAPGGAGTDKARPADVAAPGALPPEKLTVSSDVMQALLDFARKPWTSVPLRAEAQGRTRAQVRAIFGHVIDLEKAKARPSGRFRRTSYTQDVTTDASIHLGDRWGPDGRPTATKDAGGKALGDPMRVVFREGDDGTTFSLAKMKEQIGAGPGLESSAALQQTESFFVDNGLVAETPKDKVEPFEVRERRVSGEAPGGKDSDQLAQQDVLLRRTYDGKQVINSHASVGVLPGSDEVVEVKLERWTPVDGESTTTTKEASPEPEAKATAASLEEKLRRQIQLEAGGTLASAQVEHVEEAWFQSDTGLIPVLVFVVRVVFVEDLNESRNLIVAINPNGDDALIWDQGRIVRDAPDPK